jgi:hypothetical protein
MTGASGPHDETPESGALDHETFPYPTNHLLGVVDDGDRATAMVAALTSGGFLRSEIHVATGAANADALDATTGRSGLAGMLIRLAEKIGVTDEEMETKDRYERAMRENRFVVAIAAATEERKARASEILRDNGAHTVSYFGKRTIEHLVAPNAP